MAVRVPTYNWSDVMNIVGRSVGKAQENDFAQIIINATLNLVWMRWDWRESLLPLPPFWLTPSVQDYGAPLVVIPSDFFGIRTAYMYQMTSTPPLRFELDVIKDLRDTHVRYFPHAIGYYPPTQSLRIFPRCQDNIGSPQYLVTGTYKNKPTKVLASAMASTLLPFDDVYFSMWVEVAKYFAFRFTGNPAAGDVQRAGGSESFTGQMANAMHAIDEVASSESLELGDPVIAPQEGLVSSGPNCTYGLGFGLGW